jgi:cell division protein FtsI/penicillin-binding protein 2
MRKKISFSSDWRYYQKKIRARDKRKRLIRRLPLLALYSLGSFLILVFFFYMATSLTDHLSRAGFVASDKGNPAAGIGKENRGKDLSVSPTDLDLNALPPTADLGLEREGGRLFIKSSVDGDLQEFTLGLLKDSETVQAAAVVLRPRDGRILAMASHEKGASESNLCLKADFPAASLFKIVSAAAALESAGFTPDRPVFYVGRKYTLYKGQLRERRDKYAAKISFREAFASSINSVFGKLGIHSLGRDVMSEYADRFLFNRNIPFDLPVERSTTRIPDDDFGLAEIACGFNRLTRISPLHAALLASAAANHGIIMAPFLVERISNEYGDILYQRQPVPLATPITRKTAEALKSLMEETILTGTCRKSFTWLRRKEVFKDVDLGAKTGNINDKTDRFKYDWLLAYAIPPDGEETICVAVLSVHGKELGVRAYRLARKIIHFCLAS